MSDSAQAPVVGIAPPVGVAPVVGVVGLGNMGRGIANNFVRRATPLAVWDIAAAARGPYREARGVRVMAPGDMAAAGLPILFVVPATPEIAEALDGADGVLARAAEGTLVVDLTTSHPADTRALAARAAGRGVGYLDAAMSGGASGAEAGTLTLMVGGEAAALARVQPLLEVFATNIFHLGEVGAGHTMKLIHNMVVHTIFLATGEAGRMAERAGIALGDMIAVFNVSNARSYASEVRFPRHILSGTWDARSRVYNLWKDLGMAVRLAEEVGADATFGRRTLAFLEAAMARGMRDDDYSLLYREFDAIRGSSADRR